MLKHVLTPVFLFLVYMPLSSLAQEESRAVKNRKEQLEKQEEKKQKMGEKAHEEGIENHMRIQTKETRKRMKQNKKKSKRINNNRKEFFLKRWFSYEMSEENIFFAESELCCKLLV